jgi:hypothetical protein
MEDLFIRHLLLIVTQTSGITIISPDQKKRYINCFFFPDKLKKEPTLAKTL